MNLRTLRRLGAAVLFASVAGSAVAQGLGEHPAVTVAREWNSRAIDPNTFIVLPPAGTQFLAVSSTEKDQATASEQAAR